MKKFSLFFITLVLNLSLYAENFQIGTGVYDITGPAAEVTMAGFARTQMLTGGIHTRLRSRAYIVEASGERVVFVCSDILAIQQGVKLKVIEKLQKKYGDLYTVKNVMLNANHTHSGPGGYAWYTLYYTYVLGFSQRNFDAIVDGICEAITRAHNNVAPGRIFMAQGELEDVGINRSLDAYKANVDAHEHSSIDKTMTVLRFQKLNGKEIGMISWFGLHTTSVFFAHPDYGNSDDRHTNRLISSDNKGWAGRYFEMQKKTDYNEKETFVAAFANSALGDVSPNIVGNMDGGGINDYASCAISGKKQFDKAWELYNNATTELKPTVQYRHTYTDFSKITVKAKYTDGFRDYKTTFGAMGISFTAGVERDGPSDLPYIKEGMYQGKYDPSHGTKIIFLETGKLPAPWTPNILSVQLFAIGELAIFGLPAETTTHAGRRIRKAAAEELSRIGVKKSVITSPTNAFSSYVATREEYNQQHYEGGSTLFGQWTCGAYQQLFHQLAQAMANNTEVASGPTPPDLTGQQILLSESAHDEPPFWGEYGDVAEKMPQQVERLSVAEMVFWGANPRNTFKTNDSFFTIEQRTENGEWQVVRHDYDLDTAFLWTRVDQHQSKIRIMWDIPGNVAPGTYRIHHSGKAKDSSGNLADYSGYSNEFEVIPSKNLWISNCYAQGNQIHFRLEHPAPTEYDLMHNPKFTQGGKIRFVINGNRNKVYEATPNKNQGDGYFIGNVDETVTSLTVPQGYAEDADGNGNIIFSTRSLK